MSANGSGSTVCPRTVFRSASLSQPTLCRMKSRFQPAGSAEPGAYIKQDNTVGKTGEKPRVGASEVVTVLAPIRAIDVANNTVTVEGPRGNVVTLDVVKPEHRARLPQLKVGDMLRIAFTEAAAVRVQRKGR